MCHVLSPPILAYVEEVYSFGFHVIRVGDGKAHASHGHICFGESVDTLTKASIHDAICKVGPLSPQTKTTQGCDSMALSSKIRHQMCAPVSY